MSLYKYLVPVLLLPGACGGEAQLLPEDSSAPAASGPTNDGATAETSTAAATAEPLFDSAGRELTPATARIARDNASTDESFNLIARIQLSENELFEMYEPAPGIVVYSGVGSGIGAGVDPEGFSPLEIWQALVPEKPAPTAVVQANERAFDRALIESQAAPTVADEDLAAGGGEALETDTLPGDVSGAIDSAHLVEKAGGFCDSGYFTDVYSSTNVWLAIIPASCPTWSQTVCHDYTWGSWYYYNSETIVGYSNVCTVSGSTVFSTKVGSWTGDWTVHPHNWRYVFWYSYVVGDPPRRFFRSKATGTGFYHYRHRTLD